MQESVPKTATATATLYPYARIRYVYIVVINALALVKPAAWVVLPTPILALLWYTMGTGTGEDRDGWTAAFWLLRLGLGCDGRSHSGLVSRLLW